MAATVTFTGISGAQARQNLLCSVFNVTTNKNIGQIQGVNLNSNGSTDPVDLTGFAVSNGDVVKITASEPEVNGFLFVATGTVTATEIQQQILMAGGAGDSVNPQNYTFLVGDILRFRVAFAFEGDDATNKNITVSGANRVDLVDGLLATRRLAFTLGGSTVELPLNGFYNHSTMQTWELETLAGNQIRVTIDGRVAGTVSAAGALIVTELFDNARFVFDFVEYEVGGVIQFRAINRSTVDTEGGINTQINDIANSSAVANGSPYLFKRSGKYLSVDDYTHNNLEVLVDYTAPESMTPPDSNYTLVITTGQSLGSGTYPNNYRTYSTVSPLNTYEVQGTTLTKFIPDRTRVENAFMDEYAHTTNENIIRLMIAKPSTDINGLSKGTANYTEFLGFIADINTALTGNQNINKVVIIHIHGENDSNSNALNSYPPAVIQYQADLTADIRAIWAGVPVDMLISQLGNTFASGSGKIGVLTMTRAMDTLHDPSSNRYVCAPRHYLNLLHAAAQEFDETHLNTIGYTRLGMDLAATYKQLITNGTYNPLRVTGATIAGNVVTVTTNATTPIQVDPELPFSPSGGFTIENPDTSEIIPTSFEIINDTQIELTLPSTPQSGAFLWSYDSVTDVKEALVCPITDTAYVTVDGRGRKINNRLLVNRTDIV